MSVRGPPGRTRPDTRRQKPVIITIWDFHRLLLKFPIRTVTGKSPTTRGAPGYGRNHEPGGAAPAADTVAVAECGRSGIAPVRSTVSVTARMLRWV